MKITLKQIIRKASKDKKFLNALTKDSKEALNQYNLSLSPDERKILRKLLGEIGTAGERKLLRCMASAATEQKPWTSGWPKSIALPEAKKRRRKN
jgi:hypothetical protein